MEKKGLKHYLGNMPKSIWILGLVSLFMDLSSELIHSLLPIFMVSVLGANLTLVGLIEGLGESLTLIVKIFSGAISDYLGRRKVFVALGYGLAALTKPLFPLANSIGLVIFARIFDRIGKGIREAPRDALISDLVSQESRGTGFGLRQSLDTIGAILGPLAAIVLMYYFAGNIRLVFWAAVIPATISFLLVFFAVSEKRVNRVKFYPIIAYIHDVKKIGSSFWLLTLIGGILTLSRFSEAFLILKANDIGMPLNWLPSVMIIMNIAYASSALPFGVMSDIKGRKRIFIFGILSLIISCLLLGHASDILITLLGVILWGLHMGLTQSLLAAMVADVTPAHLRGISYGIFYFICGIAMLFASLIAGIIGDHYGINRIFYVGAAIGLVTLVIVCLAPMHKKVQS